MWEFKAAGIHSCACFTLGSKEWAAREAATLEQPRPLTPKVNIGSSEIDTFYFLFFLTKVVGNFLYQKDRAHLRENWSCRPCLYKIMAIIETCPISLVLQPFIDSGLYEKVTNERHFLPENNYPSPLFASCAMLQKAMLVILGSLACYIILPTSLNWPICISKALHLSKWLKVDCLLLSMDKCMQRCSHHRF